MGVYAQCADTSTKTFMLHIAVSRRPMAKFKKFKFKNLNNVKLN
jgi:hypothetical protein